MIRNFKETDLDAYIRLSDAFYHSSAVIHPIPKENFVKTFHTILQGSPYEKGVIIESDGEIAGYALLSFTYSNEVGGIVLWLDEVYICPSYQGRGLGTELLEFLDREYRDKVRRIRLEVTPINNSAIRLYKKMGYEPLDYLQMIKDFD